MRRSPGAAGAAPLLTIPYWDGPPGGLVDDGTRRPLPQHILRWSCPSIQAGPFVPGEPFELTVDVANHGRGGAIELGRLLVEHGKSLLELQRAEDRRRRGLRIGAVEVAGDDLVALLSKYGCEKCSSSVGWVRSSASAAATAAGEAGGLAADDCKLLRAGLAGRPRGARVRAPATGRWSVAIGRLRGRLAVRRRGGCARYGVSVFACARRSHSSSADAIARV